MLHFNPIHFYIKQTNKHWNDLKHMCGEAFAVMGAALRWNSLYYPVPSDGLGCDKLPAHMVLSLSHLALLCLSLQAQTPSAYPHSIPLTASPTTHPHPHPSSTPASFGPLGPRQEKPRSCAHTPLLLFRFLSSIFRRLPSTRPSHCPHMRTTRRD